MALKRVLGLVDVVGLGVGIIVGAGIYTLIGSAAAYAGSALWFSFLLAGALALLTGLTYAELSSMFPKAGSTYYYSKNAFRSPFVSFMAGWFIAAAGIIGAATVALGFAYYFSTLLQGLLGFVPDLFWGALFALAFGAAVNMRGMKDASKLNLSFTSIEVLGLVAIIAIAALFSQPSVSFESVSFANFPGIVTAMMLAFFAYLGFEVLTQTAEEMRDARKTLPKAILISIAVSIALYVLVAISFTSLLSPAEIKAALDSGTAPLVVAAAKAVAGAALLFGVIAIFSTANTVLISLIGASRMLYGMGCDKALPSAMCKTSQRGAPYFAILICTGLAAILASLKDIELVAEATVIAMLFIFTLDNLAVIVLRFKKPNARRAFVIPFSIAGVPVSAAIAIVASVAIALHELWAKPELLQLTGAMALLGLLAYFLKGKLNRF